MSLACSAPLRRNKNSNIFSLLPPREEAYKELQEMLRRQAVCIQSGCCHRVPWLRLTRVYKEHTSCTRQGWNEACGRSEDKQEEDCDQVECDKVNQKLGKCSCTHREQNEINIIIPARLSIMIAVRAVREPRKMRCHLATWVCVGMFELQEDCY